MYYFLREPSILKIVNCAVNLPQSRTIYRSPSETIMFQENKNQRSSPKSLQSQYRNFLEQVRSPWLVY